MLRIYSTVLFVCLVSWSQSSIVYANSSNCAVPAFGVSHVEIDHSGETGQIAREVGTNLATKDAVKTVLSRIVQLEEEQEFSLEAAEAADFVDFIHIQSETALANRYIATIDICLDADRLRNWMQGQNFQWAEVVSPPILILPIWQEPSGIRVWQRNNVWLQDWYNLAERHDGLVQFTTLERNLSHERQIRAASAFEQQPRTLQTAIRLADAQQLLWVYAALNFGVDDRTVSLKAALFDKDGRKSSDVLERDITLNPTTNMVLEFDQFRLDVLNKVEASWQQANLVTNKVIDSHYIISIELRSLKDWRRFQSVLRDMQEIRSARTVKLGVDLGSVRVTLAGSIAAFEQSIRAAGYDLRIEDGKYIASHKR